jgi:hypothetical protein
MCEIMRMQWASDVLHVMVTALFVSLNTCTSGINCALVVTCCQFNEIACRESSFISVWI